jgi:hypothetical protein
MLHEPASSLTDLALGLVVVGLALGLRRSPGLHRYWRTMFWWVGAAALAGAVHHGVVTRSERWAEPSWALISCMVVIGISYLLAATVVEVLGPGRGRVFWVLRSLSLVAYAALALAGHAGIEAILLCEGVTMAAVIGLWIHAARAGHPLALPLLAALAASSMAGATRAMPADVTALVGLDPTSLYHVAQIPGMVMLYGTLVGAAVVPRALRPRRQAA